MKNVLFLFVLFFSNTICAQLTVMNVSPVPRTLTHGVHDPISIFFSDEVSASLEWHSEFQVFGRWSGPMVGEFTFDLTTNMVSFIPQSDFIAGEMVTVNLTKNILSSNGDNLEYGHAFSFWIRTEPANLLLELTDVIEMKLEGEAFIQCYGAYAGDLNNDGYSDLAVVNENANDVRVLLNDGQGNYNDFTIYPMPAGFKPSPNEGADFNHDGFIDLAVSHVQSNIVSVLEGDGEGGFLPEVAYVVDQGVRGIAIIDLEADGNADIVTANRNASTISLLSNNGEGVFDNINSIQGMSESESAIAIADANNDGIMDLFVGAYSGGEVFIMINDGEGNFANGGIAPVAGQSWMIAIGDVNGDGHDDLVSANSTGNNCSVHFGDGQGAFLESFTYPTGNFPLAIDLGDLDGDGDLDMITSNYSSSNYTLYENDGSGMFINPITYQANAAGSCAIFHDRDNDGTLDLTLVDELDDVVFLYHNTPVGVEEHDVTKAFVYPNPFASEVNIKIDMVVKEPLQVYNALGEIIKSIQPTISDNQTHYLWVVDQMLPRGVYYFKSPGVALKFNKMIKL